MKILFGSAFNPPTRAHAGMIIYCQERFAPAELILLVAGDNYAFYDKTLAPAAVRLALTEVFAAEIGGCTVSDYEIKQPAFGGMVASLRHFDHPLCVIGADSLATLKAWKDAEALIAENRFLVFPRPGYDIDALLARDFSGQEDRFCVVRDYFPAALSSSKFRATRDFTLLTPAVARFITKHRLYKKERTRKWKKSAPNTKI